MATRFTQAFNGLAINQSTKSDSTNATKPTVIASNGISIPHRIIRIVRFNAGTTSHESRIIPKPNTADNNNMIM
jgi:hypothetical protein